MVSSRPLHIHPVRHMTLMNIQIPANGTNERDKVGRFRPVWAGLSVSCTMGHSTAGEVAALATSEVCLERKASWCHSSFKSVQAKNFKTARGIQKKSAETGSLTHLTPASCSCSCFCSMRPQKMKAKAKWERWHHVET